ncbi:MAG TPA: class III extradiol dioxygenase subunit B-like domain-containing protein [Jiangellaceae bacterium]|nr:class III extradiol dioxygenase subunit B-like domain-containing protein [Jiangellaceae bacterium]
MLVAAAVCPHPPGIVPELATGAADELAELRRACTVALDAIEFAAPEVLVIVGTGDATRTVPPGSTGSFASYGKDIRTTLGSGDAGDDALALPLLVGAWLLDRHGWAGPVRGALVAHDAPVEVCVALGTEIAESADRVGMLVMGDGAACRTAHAPRPFDPRGEEFDRSVIAALDSGEPAGLVALDPAQARDVSAAGRAAWQVLAGAAGEAIFDAEILYDRAPYGVGYFVAVWERHG